MPITAERMTVHEHISRLRPPAALVIVLILAFAESPALAQARRTGAISGVVKDSIGNILGNVEVTALKTGQSVRTDSAGKFLLADLPHGLLDITFRRLAYQPVILSIDVPNEDTTDVQVTLGVVAQKLTGVVVQAHAEHLRQLRDFEARRKRGIGHFITREQIEERDPELLSDMVRLIPGVVLVPTGAGRPVMRFSRAAKTNCPVQFYVDGVQVDGFNIDDMPPGDVEGMELYAGPGGLPPQFNRLYSTSNCGTVLIWTRIPGND